jgi:hypothetical protein
MPAGVRAKSPRGSTGSGMQLTSAPTAKKLQQITPRTTPKSTYPAADVDDFYTECPSPKAAQRACLGVGEGPFRPRRRAAPCHVDPIHRPRPHALRPLDRVFAAEGERGTVNKRRDAASTRRGSALGRSSARSQRPERRMERISENGAVTYGHRSPCWLPVDEAARSRIEDCNDAELSARRATRSSARAGTARTVTTRPLTLRR